MISIFLKVIGYFILRYIAFFIILFTAGENVKTVQSSDLKSGEDWFIFLWLFGLPFLFEILIIGLPMSFGLNKLSSATNKLLIYRGLFVLFVIEFFIANWIYGTQSAFIKIGASLILFIALFWKRLL